MGWYQRRVHGRRAVVTNELEADVKKIEAFISVSENKLIIPNKLEIERNRNFRKERFVDMATYRNNKIENEDTFLETYQDLAYGTIKFNHEGEETAVTLEKKINLCGREAYETRVKNIFVVLLGREEGFLERRERIEREEREEI